MYVKYLGEVSTSVWSNDGTKVVVEQGMVFKTSTPNARSYLRSKKFEEASIVEFDSQKKKPQVVQQPQAEEAPVSESVVEPSDDSTTEEAPVEPKSKKK